MDHGWLVVVARRSVAALRRAAAGAGRAFPRDDDSGVGLDVAALGKPSGRDVAIRRPHSASGHDVIGTGGVGALSTRDRS